MFGFGWRKRAIEAEKLCSQMQDLTRRAVLMSIHRDGRKIVFTFMKNGEIHRISAMGTWSDDIDAWTKVLIGE